MSETVTLPTPDPRVLEAIQGKRAPKKPAAPVDRVSNAIAILEGVTRDIDDINPNLDRPIRYDIKDGWSHRVKMALTLLRESREE